MKFLLTTLALAVTFTAAAAQNENPHVVQTAVTVANPGSTEELNIAEITHDLVTRDMGNDEWHKFVQKVHNRFEDWSREFDNGNLKQFLDDRLIALAPTVTNGKGETLREFCRWLALYKVFSEPLPRYIRDISDEDKLWIKNTLADFDWEGAALKIKENAKR
ncbi:MAG TPA: hypothetical protein VEJ63_07905 [Planctomycetota bacterium]|nr:hypothetical protein [Planctomycetota bacterium]